MAYEYQKTEDNIPFRQIKELGEEGWIAALHIPTTEEILWCRELQENEEKTQSTSKAETGEEDVDSGGKEE